MRRRDFLGVGVGAVVVSVLPADEAATISAQDYDWSIEFCSITAGITTDTYETFYNGQLASGNPEKFLGYLLTGTSLPPIQKVASMQVRANRADNTAVVTFTGVVFASNTRCVSADFFAGYEHAQFCLSSPNSKSGMRLAFSNYRA